MACDTLGCIYRAKGHVVGLVRRAEALSEDCWSADVVVSGRCARRVPRPAS
jgi:competence protein ComEC